MGRLTKFLIFTSFILLLRGIGLSQDSLAGTYTEVSSIGLAKHIGRTIYSCFAPENFSPETGYSQLNFKTPKQTPVLNQYVTRPLLIKFNVWNRADTATPVCFFPGYYYKTVTLYRLQMGKLERLKTIKPDYPDNFCIEQFTIAPNDSVTLVANLQMAKTYSNTIRPRLINPKQIEAHFATIRSAHTDVDIVTYIFCGLLLMMILYSLAIYVQGGNREFLYYALYAFFMGAMLSTKAFYDLKPTAFSIFQEEYLDYIMQCLGIICYMVFMQKFLNTKKEHPFLQRLYAMGIALLFFSIAFYTFLHYFSSNYPLQNLTENATKIFLLLMIVVFLAYSFRRWKNKLLRYLFWGNLLLLIFSLLSQTAVMFQNIIENMPGLLNSALFYYEMGLFSEFVLFLAGLNYKNRRRIIEETREKETLKAQNKMQEYEKQLAVLKAQEQERERISSDIHDELGAGMTAIRLMSEIAKSKMKESTPVELEKISSSANEVLNKMNAIIWSMNSGNDSLDNLISYIRAYAQEYFDGTPVSCRIIAPDAIPDVSLSGDKRRNIFLCVKESLNNILKHAGATEVAVEISTDNSLTVKITDNGKGIHKEKVRQFGNGLKNIARRMESIGGSFSIENNTGTVTTLLLPY
jgi:signal transduction histidine kinase